MNLHFDTSLAEGYKSTSQIVRVLTENWMGKCLLPELWLQADR